MESKRKKKDRSVPAEDLIRLRESMGLSRQQFCEYMYDIPYQTCFDWEKGKRRVSAYVFKLMEYKAKNDGMIP